MERENYKTLINNSVKYSNMELKAYCLQYDLHKLYNKSRSVYNIFNDMGTIPNNMSFSSFKQYYNIYNYFWRYPSLASICDNLNKARRMRTARLNNKIDKMISLGDCIFLTLTFKPEVLDNTCQATRKKYLQRYLKSQSLHYCANIDYGTKNEREHYHAILFTSKVDMKPWKEYGFAYAEKVDNKKSSPEKIAKYISKLTNHAIKNTAKNNKIIYSKNWGELVLKSRNKKLCESDDTIALGFDLFGEDLKVY